MYEVRRQPSEPVRRRSNRIPPSRRIRRQFNRARKERQHVHASTTRVRRPLVAVTRSCGRSRLRSSCWSSTGPARHGAGVEPPRGAADQRRTRRRTTRTSTRSSVPTTRHGHDRSPTTSRSRSRPAGRTSTSFGDDVLYEIKVDNNGDGSEDITLPVPVRRQTRNPNTFLYNTGPIGSLTDPNWNRPQTYNVTRVDQGSRRRRGCSARRARRRPVNIGPRSTPNYGSLAGGGGHGRCRAGSRSSPASATTRSSSTSARSSTWPACGRSTLRT